MAQEEATVTISPSIGERPRFRLKMRQREAVMGYLFLTPWIIGFLVFLLGPMIASIYFSLTTYKVLKPPVWLGLGNYERMFSDPFFYLSLRVTATYTFISVPLYMTIALAIALLLNQKIRGSTFFRTVFYMPSVISGVAVAIVFSWIFNYRFGILNYFLSLVGIEGPNWLGHPRYALAAFVIMGIWGIGGNIVIYLAALQGVPEALYEAATLDGASNWRRLWAITLPMISPVLLFSLIMGVIGTFQTFTQSYIMTGGGPANATLFYLLYLYRNAFNWFEMGYASALAWFLFLVIIVCTLILWRTSGKWVYYEGESQEVRG